MEQKRKALIVSGGSVGEEFLRQLLSRETFELVIAVDNGLYALHRAGRIPDILAGDFDTADPALVEEYQNKPGVSVRRFRPEKDATDTEIAVRLAVENRMEEVTIVGGLGTRMDHSVANIQLLLFLLKQQVRGVLADEHNRIYMTAQPLSLQKSECFGTYLSLLPVTDEVLGITLTGMKYPLDHAVLKKGSSLGVSNEICTGQAQISFEEGILLVIEAKD